MDFGFGSPIRARLQPGCQWPNDHHIAYGLLCAFVRILCFNSPVLGASVTIVQIAIITNHMLLLLPLSNS